MRSASPVLGLIEPNTDSRGCISGAAVGPPPALVPCFHGQREIHPSGTGAQSDIETSTWRFPLQFAIYHHLPFVCHKESHSQSALFRKWLPLPFSCLSDRTVPLRANTTWGDGVACFNFNESAILVEKPSCVK